MVQHYRKWNRKEKSPMKVSAKKDLQNFSIPKAILNLATIVEAVREVQKPVRYTPLKFSNLHRDILSFAKTGNLAADHNGYEDVLGTMARTLIGRKYRVSSTATPSRLYVSSEFSKTVKLQGQMYDNLQVCSNILTIYRGCIQLILAASRHLGSLE